ncbi:MAG: FAD-dependent oxidoreductase [Anaerolineales bacterium]|nr:FAD-dependent oxidoreductase [Anaerolineales bacterium]
MSAKPILVLGAGVSGLSTAITLLRAGLPVAIWARELPPHTTSNQAAALWFPYLAQPLERVNRWANVSLQFFREQLLPDPASGCQPVTVHDLYDHPVAEPWWAAAAGGDYRRLDPGRLPAGYRDGFETESVVIDTSIYMDYLVAWFRRLGGELLQKEVASMYEALAVADVVINCTGLGSRQLAGDDSVYPVRGQTARVRPNGFGEALLDDEGPNSLGYIIPRSADIVLGGTAQENDWDLSLRASDRADILRKAAAMHPAFAEVEILSEGVGLRPARPTVRLEAEALPDGKRLVHNYGHGGAGFTLSWGCAEEARMKMKG